MPVAAPSRSEKDFAADAVPPLRDGDRLNREEFHRRYEAMPSGVPETRFREVWAELIDGVVHLDRVPGDLESGRMRADVGRWLGWYMAAAPGVDGGSHVSMLLDNANEYQPATMLMLAEAAGGRARSDAVGHLVAPPELVVEVRDWSKSIDMRIKPQVYARAGVQEFLLVLLEETPAEVRWMTLDPANGPTPIEADADGILKSNVFPGLWLDPAALLAGDGAALLATLDRGLATEEHAAFAERVQPATE